MGCGTSTEAGLGEDGNSSPYMKRADTSEPKSEKDAEETKQVGEENGDIKAEVQNGHVEATSESEPEVEKGPYVPKGGVLVMPLPPPMRPKYDVEGQMGEADENGVVKRRNGNAGKPRVPTGGFLVMPDLAPEPDEDSGKPISAPAAIKPIMVVDMADKRRTIVEEAEESDEEEEEDLINENIRFQDSNPGVEMVTIGSSGEVAKAVNLDIPEGEFWTDEEFTQEMALKGIKNTNNLEWKRPSEFAAEPVLFSEGSTRFDVNQEGADTCWYLSILAVIADLPQLLSQIIPDGAYDPASGVFHCKFWSFGEWLDVHVDDHLPIKNGRPWGAYSKSDPNEMWPSLIEKAFAKFSGSYQKVFFGGNPGFAFTSLTAGVSEHIQLNATTPKTFFQRVHDALKSGYVVASAASESKDNDKGLIGSHAYTITSSAKVKYEGKIVHLYRLRNPWGDGEWKGPWSDGSRNWDGVSKTAKSSLEVKSHEDGEFWISADDYHEFFNDVFICSVTPDLDKDGVNDGLKNITAIFGEWKSDTAAGYEMSKKWKNPQFMVTVPEIESGQATTPVVLQFLIKDSEHQTISYRVELLKVLHEAAGRDKKSIVLKDLTEDTNFYTANQWTYQYSLEPGHYLIVPMTFKPEEESEFLMRLFSSVEIGGAVFDEVVVHHLTTFKSVFTYYKTNYKVEQVQYMSGDWKKDVNAGGQICHKTCATNPQYVITIFPGQDAEKLHPVVVSLMQNPEKCHPPEPIGVKLFELPMIFAPPLDLETLWKVNESHTQRTIGQQDQVFVVDAVCSARYLLKEGRYLLLCHQNTPGIDNSYICSVASNENVKIE